MKKRSDSGVAMVTALMIVLILAFLAAGLGVSSQAGIQTENSFKAQQRAFEAAVAGLERGREVLRQCIFDGIVNPSTAPAACLSLDAQLASAAGANGTLVSAGTLASFDAHNAFAALDDVPLIPDTVLGGGTYRVYLTNDPWDEAVNPLVDGSDPKGRNVVTLTSFARGANDVGFSSVQSVYRTGLDFPIPRLPGVVTLPGPDVNFDAANSQPAQINGDADDPCFPAIATSTTAARDLVRSLIPQQRRPNYVTCDLNGGTVNATTVPGSIENFIDETVSPNPYNSETTNDPLLSPPGDATLGNVGLAGCVGDERDFVRAACMLSLRQAVESQADAHFAVGVTPPNDANVMGSPDDPKIVVIDGDYTLDPPGTSAFGGILVVKGTFRMTGNGAYTGLVLAIGQGNVDRSGGGNGTVCGGILAVDIIDNGEVGDNYITSNGLVGIPSYSHNGGGTSLTGTCENALDGDQTAYKVPLTRLSFQQLR